MKEKLDDYPAFSDKAIKIMKRRRVMMMEGQDSHLYIQKIIGLYLVFTE